MHRTSFTVQVWDAQMDIIKKAAKKQNVSVMEYVRQQIMPLAAHDAGVSLPEFPEFRKGRPKGWLSMQRQAAELSGIPYDKWRKQILDSVAEEVVKKLGSGAPAPIVRRPKAAR